MKYLSDKCFSLKPGDMLIVDKFGKDSDLRLFIYKSQDYDPLRGEYNLVRIEVRQLFPNGKVLPVTDIDEVSAGNDELDRMLEMIWNKENLEVLC